MSFTVSMRTRPVAIGSYVMLDMMRPHVSQLPHSGNSIPERRRLPAPRCADRYLYAVAVRIGWRAQQRGPHMHTTHSTDTPGAAREPFSVECRRRAGCARAGY